MEFQWLNNIINTILGLDFFFLVQVFNYFRNQKNFK